MDLIVVLPYAQAMLVFSLIGLVVGMIRPLWDFFWLGSPSRKDVFIVYASLFIFSLTSVDIIIQKLEAQKRERSSTPATVSAPAIITPPTVQPKATQPPVVRSAPTPLPSSQSSPPAEQP